MQKVSVDRTLGLIVAFAIFLGTILYLTLERLEVLYLMVTVIVLAGIWHEKDRKKNSWKYIIGYGVLIGLIYLLFNQL